MIIPENNSFIEIENTEKIKSKIKFRYNILDNYKGILIFLVVFAHFLYEYSIEHKDTFCYNIVKYIYTFHIPSFIISSGFLSKSINSRSLKALTKLILIYFIFNFLHGLILYLYENENLQLLCPYNSYWFLLCIIYWRFSINYFANQYCSIIISFIISILIGFWKEIASEFSLKRAFSFFPYFLIGYKISKENFNKIIEIRKHFHIIIYSLFAIFLFFSIKFFPEIELSHSMMNSSYNLYYREDIKIRIKLFIFSFMYIIINVLILPNKEIPFITKIGKNSLFIYIFHRIFTIISYHEIFSSSKNNSLITLNSLIFSIFICFIFGSNYFANVINKLIIYLHDNLKDMNKKGKKIWLFFSFSFIGILMIQPLKIIKEEKQKELDIIMKTTLSMKLINTNEFEKAIRISYIGDLILLKDQVISAKNNITGKYEFDEMFKNTWDYLQKSELSIGVYEGPSAGNKTSYSTSNYGDGIPLYLNFPDEFAKSVKKAGISLVTTANNHLLDRGINGALRTIDILNQNNITHTGSYRSSNEKSQLLVLNISNIKFAILSYTSSVNLENIEKLYEKYPYLTSFIPKLNNKYYNEILIEIKNDFKKARNAKPDYIVVLAHMGSEFSDSTDIFQKKWNKIFSELGADIILGDHSHHVQPLEQLGNTFIVNCPGNFANSYIKKNGDATSIVNLYFNKNTKKLIGSSIIPMYTQEYKPKYFRALPIFKIFNNSINITSKELLRIKKVQKLITKTMIGKEIPLSEMKENYFFINNSYIDISNKETNIKKLKKKILIKKYIN
jgi:fucose 4-O-acetylase-like acetyltransferase